MTSRSALKIWTPWVPIPKWLMAATLRTTYSTLRRFVIMTAWCPGWKNGKWRLYFSRTAGVRRMPRKFKRYTWERVSEARIATADAKQHAGCCCREACQAADFENWHFLRASLTINLAKLPGKRKMKIKYSIYHHLQVSQAQCL